MTCGTHRLVDLDLIVPLTPTRHKLKYLKCSPTNQHKETSRKFTQSCKHKIKQHEIQIMLPSTQTQDQHKNFQKLFFTIHVTIHVNSTVNSNMQGGEKFLHNSTFQTPNLINPKARIQFHRLKSLNWQANHACYLKIHMNSRIKNKHT